MVHSEHSHFSLNAAKGPRMSLKQRLDLPLESGTNTQFASDINSHRVLLRMQQAWNENETDASPIVVPPRALLLRKSLRAAGTKDPMQPFEVSSR